ncbi:MAG TPA: pirin family protein [Methylophilaceae bacterium]|nr:pirin family protein [Methylophilaceae bacterium]HQR60241.1 pirin family protein [Methylophilaceae bacterium]
MIQLRKSNARGHADHGWLNARHTFSFADYYDPAFMGYSVLRVINDDEIAPGRGFGTHPHRDMEIITYILDGALQHRDSMGNGSVIRAGDVQYMSAGSGVRHSEVNPSPDAAVHLLQIWILPAQPGLVPQYDQKTIAAEQKRGRWRMLASPDGREDSITIRQDAMLLATMLDSDADLTYRSQPGRRQYLHLARGTAALNNVAMRGGDGAFIENENLLTLSDAKGAEALLFDLP